MPLPECGGLTQKHRQLADPTLSALAKWISTNGPEPMLTDDSFVPQRDYSDRNAIMGSTRVAQRAGR
jgi:hypothetical protein